MHRGQLLCAKKILGALMLLTLVAGCDNSTSVPTHSTPPLILSVSSPYRMVEFDADSLLVSDARTNAVHFIDKSSLMPTKSLRVSGRPSGIAHFSNLLYVGNLTTGSVDVVDTDGTFQFHLGGSQGLFQQVNDISIDQSAGLVYVLDSQAALIRTYNANDGSDTGLVIGSGVLARPTALEVDQIDGRILVSDYGASPTPIPQIRVFNSDGSGATADPILGSTVGFSMPQGLFVDSDQNLFLAEARTSEVRITDSGYNYVQSVGSRGVGEGELYYPLDVFVDDSTKDVFVTDNQNRRITVYLGGGTVP